jgi:hypothetical protein
MGAWRARTEWLLLVLVTARVAGSQAEAAPKHSPAGPAAPRARRTEIAVAKLYREDTHSQEYCASQMSGGAGLGSFRRPPLECWSAGDVSMRAGAIA